MCVVFTIYCLIRFVCLHLYVGCQLKNGTLSAQAQYSKFLKMVPVRGNEKKARLDNVIN